MEPSETTTNPRLGALFGAAPIGVAWIRPPSRIEWANPAFYSTSGRNPKVLGHELSELPEFQKSPVLPALEAAFGQGAPAIVRRIRASAHSPPIYVDVRLWPTPATDGEAPGVLLLINEVTEREREHESARLFHASFLTSTNPMELTDKNGVLVDVNPSFEKMYGYSRLECLGKRPNLVRSRHTSPEIYERMWTDLLDPSRGYWSGEILNRDRMGREKPVFLTITAIRDEAGETTHYLGVAVDLAERRAWERSAAHADKLASLGQLAAGVAHEINTPLANVMLVAESLRRRSTDPWVLSRVETITSQVEVAARIVRGLLDFARRNEPNFTTLDLNVVARESVGFLRGKQSANVEVEEHYPSEPMMISGDRIQLMQALTNVLNNAYDALADNGKIWVEVRLKGHREVEVEVTDSGPGIPQEDLARIFDPFFTTKSEGKGTGLGLAIVHGIIQAHHGRVAAHNSPGRGASFTFIFPRSSSKGEAHPAPPPAPHP